LKDWYLAVGVFLLVFIDLIILLTYNIVEGVQGNLTAVRVPNRENVMDVNGVGCMQYKVRRYKMMSCICIKLFITLNSAYVFEFTISQLFHFISPHPNSISITSSF